MSEAGEIVSVKSGGGGGAETVAITDVVCDSIPDDPESVTVALPAAALEEAVSVVFCAVPGERLRVAGLAVTPVGSPDNVTATIPENPLIGLAVTLTSCPPPPGIRLTEEGDAESVKSGCS